MFEKSGIASQEQVKEIFPSVDRINNGPVAVIECFQKIPCNPCYKSCKFNAISDLSDINDVPLVDTDNCTGCGICVYNCPGLAIMVVDGSISDEYVLFKIPYEFYPLPEAGQTVTALNRSGKAIGEATVIKVQNAKAMDRTPVVHVEVPRGLLYEFRNIRMEKR